MKANSLIKKSKDKVKKNFIIEIPRYVVTWWRNKVGKGLDSEFSSWGSRK